MHSVHAIRHGETALNKDKKIAGHQDVPLTSYGKSQVADAAATLPTGITHIFCSTFRRTRETLEILIENNPDLKDVPVTYTDDLRERGLGELEGLSWEEAEAKHGEGLRKTDRHLQYDYTAFGGESSDGVRERLHRVIAEVRKLPAGSNVLFVTSSGVIKMLQYLAEAHDPEVRTENAGVYSFGAAEDGTIKDLTLTA